MRKLLPRSRVEPRSGVALFRGVRILTLRGSAGICRALSRRIRLASMAAVARMLVAGVLVSTGALYAASLPPASAQDLTGEVHDEQDQPVPGAVCTLTAPMLPEGGLPVTTDEQGRFTFPGLAPGTYSLSCAAVGYQPVARSGIEIAGAAPPFLQFILPPEIKSRQQIEVRAQAPSAAEQGAAPPAEITAPQLQTLPLIEQKFKAALPLTPGVIRTPDGKINIKGEVESQGLLLVDSAEMVDPVTGEFSIQIPIDAVESISVYKSIYRADVGRFSGGLTTLDTKAPSGKFDYELNDFLPTPRIKGGQIVGIADDEPRLYLTGPLIKDKLNFAESFEYDVNNQPVRGLAWPHNEIKTQGFNSFSSFQYIASSNQVISGTLDFFPRRQEFADISSLVPQSASTNYGQKGFSAGVTDRYLFSSGGILTSLFQFMKFDSNAYGQGPQPMLVTPDGWGGNFFNAYSRNSDQQQLSETYQLPRKDWHGRHELKVGVEAIRRSYSAHSDSHSVLVRREDGSLAEQIDFRGPAFLSATDTEIAAFIGDHWAPADNLSFDAGLRYSGQTVGDPATLAPRFGAVYMPGSSGKTILRGGIGLFYDRVPLLAGDFTENPERVVTYFNNQGVALGPPTVFQNAYVKVNENGQQVVPSHDRLASTPHNLTWNLEADRELAPGVLVRVSYLSSRTYQEFVINPLSQPGTPPTLLLSNTGVSRYNEFESTLRLRPKESADLNFSYVHSLARGDLNTLSAVYVPFESPVIRPNLFGTLPSNVPDRFITWADFKLPYESTISPVFDVHSGFPYSPLDVLQNYAGVPNSLRFPAFASLDLKLTKDFKVPFIPWLRNHKLRGAFSIFNLTDHSNPRDVFNSTASPFFGQFVGFQHRFYDAYLDIVY
jgi:Carboxypeptidase regulatory-like domain